jgi:hypothetical protein
MYFIDTIVDAAEDFKDWLLDGTDSDLGIVFLIVIPAWFGIVHYTVGL